VGGLKAPRFGSTGVPERALIGDFRVNSGCQNKLKNVFFPLTREGNQPIIMELLRYLSFSLENLISSNKSEYLFLSRARKKKDL
jgi:hypothetical protein